MYSQTSNGEGQTTDLVLESLTHISVLICEPSQANIFLFSYSPCISQQITKTKTKTKEALGTLLMVDMETHLRKKSLRRVYNLPYYLLSNVEFWSLKCGLK